MRSGRQAIGVVPITGANRKDSLIQNRKAMKEIKVTEKEVEAAFKVAKSEETKAVLAALFCKDENKPNLDDYKSIKTYEDACIALNITPIDFNALAMIQVSNDQNVGSLTIKMPDHIKALIKLETISRALWGKNWEPKPDAEGSKVFWWPWFALYTQSEIDNMSDKDKGALLSAFATYGASAGFGSLHTSYRSSYSYARIGFRLCQETEEKADYFGRQFKELWAEYLAFNFTVGDPIV